MTTEKGSLKVNHFIEKRFFSILDDDYLSKALGEMYSNNVKGLLVFDRNCIFKGVLTEEIITKSYLDPSTTKVKSLAVMPPKNITENDDVYKAAYILFNSHLPIIPVFDKDKKEIIGVLEIKSLIKKYSEIDKQFSNMRIIDIATTDVVTVNEYDTLGNALRLMRENKITRLPILGKNGKLTGILTLHDIIEKLIKPKYRSQKFREGERVSREKIKITEYPVKEIMNNVVFTIDPLATVKECIKMMEELNVSSLVIIEDDKVKGIVTDKDILGYIASLYQKPEKFKVLYAISGDVEELDKYELEDAIEHVRNVIQRYEDYLNSGNIYIYIKQHDERFRSMPLYHIRIRLSSEKGVFIGIGETWGLYNAIGCALKKLRDQIEYKRELEKDPYLGLRALVKEVANTTVLPNIKGPKD